VTGGTLDRAIPNRGDTDQRIGRIAALVMLPTAVACVPFAENLVSAQKGTLTLLL